MGPRPCKEELVLYIEDTRTSFPVSSRGNCKRLQDCGENISQLTFHPLSRYVLARVIALPVLICVRPSWVDYTAAGPAHRGGGILGIPDLKKKLLY